ncbi:MAG TPA: MarR family transcriptional regulator [Candidatus Saccharimonadales bacterium]
MQTDTELMSLIKRLAALLTQNVDLWLKPYDLARTQYIVLRRLETGMHIASELAASMQIEQATLSGLIDTLETKGLVERTENIEDKRRKDVQLTAAGRKLLAAIPPPGPVMERVLRRDVDPGDVHILRAVGQQMVRSLEAELQRQEREQ